MDKPVAFAFNLHDSLWESFEEKRDIIFSFGGQNHVISYQDYPDTLRSRVVIAGVTWESQNMRKPSPNMERVASEDGYRITWGFRFDGEKIEWLAKIESQVYEDGSTTYKNWDLTQRPNRLQATESINIPPEVATV